MARAPYSTDPRGESTRASLVQAYVQLLEQGGAATAGDVSERAGVNRSSFYAHFTSIDDLAAHAFRTELEVHHRANLARQLTGEVPAPVSNAQVIHDIIAMAAAPTGTMMVMLRADRASGESTLGVILRDYIQQYFETVPAFSSVTAARRAVAREYVGHALASLIVGWLLDELPVERSSLEALVAAMTPAWIIDPALLDVAE